ncbi:glycine-rich protein DOT1-like [Ostrinia furnacalis]|uniref:glycine-rich protein DOT1-like n=1 Tax=Ostrinia furnacalis TaxID=93504 RepID=UPI00103BFAD9|nr:glycine-rich protein DOT1-like [Ostrinia furnacalis]
MAKWSIIALAIFGCAVAEPPVGYSYSAPSSLVVVGGGHSSGGLSHGGHYTPVPVGHQTSEGYHVDPHLLEKIKHIILKDEIQNQAYQSASSGHGHGHGHGISSHYGPPAPVYGVPQDRIVGIELDHVQQGIQVAQYHQAEEGYASGYAGGYAGGYSGYSSGGHGGFSSGGHGGYSSGGHGGFSSGGHGGFSSGGHASISYSAPSIAYTTIGVPSGSYGVPSPSSSYGAPHH